MTLVKSRLIKGWRQVPRVKPGPPGSRFLPFPRPKAPPKPIDTAAA